MSDRQRRMHVATRERDSTDSPNKNVDKGGSSSISNSQVKFNFHSILKTIELFLIFGLISSLKLPKTLISAYRN